MKALEIIKQNRILIFILLAGALLRIYHADYQSIWLDEIFSMIESDPKLSLSEFDSIMMAREGMGHLYFFTLRLLHIVFGYSTATARLFSAFIGITTLFGMYLFVKVLYNKRAGLIAAALLSVNLFHISYSQEARPYALLVLFTVFSFYRLVLYIRESSLKNGIYLGVFSGLMVNAHFIGAITVFCEYLLILIFLFYIPKNDRKEYFKNLFISGIVALIVILPTYRLFIKMSKYHSGWLQLPGTDGFSDILRQFFGSTELLYFIFNVLFIFYIIKLFSVKQEEVTTLEALKQNRLLLSGVIVFIWLFLYIVIAILKSYLNEPMILHRYFIHLLPALITALAIGIELISNKISKGLVITAIIVFSLLDIIVIKDYYNKISKTQFRELTDQILARNKESHQEVSSCGWLMNHFLNQDKNHPVIEMTLSAYVQALKNGSIEMESFWYLDGNSRPYTLTTDEEAFLNENFLVKDRITKYDAWARHYISKRAQKSDYTSTGIKSFPGLVHDQAGNAYIFENAEIKSGMIAFEKGNYDFIIEASSLPTTPIDGQHAHLIIKLGNEVLGDVYLKADKANSKIVLPIVCKGDMRERISIVFDNDIAKYGQDRNVIVYSIKIEKK